MTWMGARFDSAQGHLSTMRTKDVALILLYNPDKRILLQHRTKDAPRLPLHWAFFGGGIEEGESPETAVRREALEELGYNVSDSTNAAFRMGELLSGFRYIFLEKYDINQKLVQNEGDGMGWFSLEESLKLKMSDTDRETLRLAQEIVMKQLNH